jgi:hypothetical protein
MILLLLVLKEAVTKAVAEMVAVMVAASAEEQLSLELLDLMSASILVMENLQKNPFLENRTRLADLMSVRL